jgi:hypothetical protein
MKVDLYPEYRGKISEAIVSNGREIITTENELKKYMKTCVMEMPRSIGTYDYSVWIRDPAIFLGYTNEKKPLILMSDEEILCSIGSPKDVSDAFVMREYMQKRDFCIDYAPFFVIGGDCLIDKNRAIFGFTTSQITGWFFQKHIGPRKIADAMGKLGVETLVLDDSDFLDEYLYHKRRESGFFHIDTIFTILPGNDKMNAIVCKPYKMNDTVCKLHGSETGKKYVGYITEKLSENGYNIIETPAIFDGMYIWSPVNSLVDGEKKKIFITPCHRSEDFTKEAEKIYSELGYETVVIDADAEINAHAGGLRCISFALKEDTANEQ